MKALSQPFLLSQYAQKEQGKSEREEIIESFIHFGQSILHCIPDWTEALSLVLRQTINNATSTDGNSIVNTNITNGWSQQLRCLARIPLESKNSENYIITNSVLRQMEEIVKEAERQQKRNEEFQLAERQKQLEEQQKKT